MAFLSAVARFLGVRGRGVAPVARRDGGPPAAASPSRGGGGHRSSAAHGPAGAATPPPSTERLQYAEIIEYDPSLRRQPSRDQLAAIRDLAPVIRNRCMKLTEDLPPLPTTASRVLAMCRDDSEVSLNELVRLVSQDAALAAAILRVANSATYLRGSPVEVIRDALIRLGLAEAARVVAAVASRPLFTARGTGPEIDWAAHWQHALTCGFSASWFGMECRVADADRAFVGGLLHDIGKLPVLRALATLVEDGTLPMPDVAAMEYAVDDLHVEIGVMLAERWQLPEQTLHLIAAHHEPVAEGAPRSVDHVIRLVSALDEMRINPMHRGDLSISLRQCANALEVDDRQLRRVLHEVRALAAKATALIGSASS